MTSDSNRITIDRFELADSEFIGETSEFPAKKYKAYHQLYLDEMAKPCTISKATPIDRVPLAGRLKGMLFLIYAQLAH